MVTSSWPLYLSLASHACVIPLASLLSAVYSLISASSGRGWVGRRFVDVRAAMGFTPIHMAASQGHWQTVAALLANGASLAVRFIASCTACCVPKTRVSWLFLYRDVQESLWLWFDLER